jgi:hypothetical protein
LASDQDDQGADQERSNPQQRGAASTGGEPNADYLSAAAVRQAPSGGGEAY